MSAIFKWCTLCEKQHELREKCPKDGVVGFFSDKYVTKKEAIAEWDDFGNDETCNGLDEFFDSERGGTMGLNSDEKLLVDLLEMLTPYAKENGSSEGAVETLNKLLNELEAYRQYDK